MKLLTLIALSLALVVGLGAATIVTHHPTAAACETGSC
jgi:hypothetical protein